MEKRRGCNQTGFTRKSPALVDWPDQCGAAVPQDGRFCLFRTGLS
jgi:hypothetical protein